MSSLLVEFLTRPTWQRDALCREYPDVDFFADRGPAIAARAICRRCLVTVECLAFAIDQEINDGIFGGTSLAMTCNDTWVVYCSDLLVLGGR